MWSTRAGQIVAIQSSKPADETSPRLIQSHPMTSSSSMPLHSSALTHPTFPSDTLGSGGTSAPLATSLIALPVLVQRLLEPGRATDETNDICISIMLHPDLARDSFALRKYSKMSGGLHNYYPGSSRAWLYTPRNHPSRPRSSNSEDDISRLSLIFVYPEESGSANTDRREPSATTSRNKLHFGGRTFPLWNNSVLIQHGAHKPLKCAIHLI